ncbi:unnamed protein product, partial [Adineta steineri]
LELTESAARALLSYQEEKASCERRAKVAHEQTNAETENLKNLKQKHDDLVKEIEERGEILKKLENTVEEMGKEFV